MGFFNVRLRHAFSIAMGVLCLVGTLYVMFASQRHDPIAALMTAEPVESPAATSVPPSSQQMGPFLKLGVMNMWGRAPQVLRELWIISLITLRAVGMPLHASYSPADADVVFIGPYNGAKGMTMSEELVRQSRKDGARFVTVFIAPECLSRSDMARSDMAGRVDVCFGQAKIPPAKANGTFLRLPWWLPYTLERGRCAFPEAMKRGSSASDWRSRPRFATIMTRHKKYPRQVIYDAIRTIGPIDSPRGPFKNMTWPAHLPDSHLTGKASEGCGKKSV